MTIELAQIRPSTVNGKNRSSAISITDEDIRKLTDRFEVVYAVGDPMRSLRHRTRLPKLDPAERQAVDGFLWGTTRQLPRGRKPQALDTAAFNRPFHQAWPIPRLLSSRKDRQAWTLAVLEADINPATAQSLYVVHL
jgi:hypothetical protein